MVVALGRLFDNDPRNVSIRTLIRAAPEFEQIESGKLSRAEGIWKRNAKTLRDQIVAHHAGNTTVQESFRRANIRLHDIEQLISLCENLVDAWTRHAGCHVHILSGSETDTLALLDALLEGINAQHSFPKQEKK